MLLDSNILIYGATGSHERLDQILDRNDLAIASVCQIETLGFHRLSEQERFWLVAAMNRMRVLPLDTPVVSQAIALRCQRNMGLADAIVAATALVHRLPLVTRNTTDFKHIAELTIVDPFSL